MILNLYLGGGLFNAAERLHNLYLEKYLKEFGCYHIILPQRRALAFFDGEKFDVDAIAADCAQSCSDENVLYVGSLDGSDADSGGSVEYGITIFATGRAVTYRTDFRTALDRELGVNGMFRVKRTTLVYHPCFITELSEVEDYYRALAKKLHEAIVELHK
jgi:nucleoside 2-deoxyribosyltransferase